MGIAGWLHDCLPTWENAERNRFGREEQRFRAVSVKLDIDALTLFKRNVEETTGCGIWAQKRVLIHN